MLIKELLQLNESEFDYGWNPPAFFREMLDNFRIELEDLGYSFAQTHSASYMFFINKDNHKNYDTALISLIAKENNIKCVFYGDKLRFDTRDIGLIYMSTNFVAYAIFDTNKSQNDTIHFKEVDISNFGLDEIPKILKDINYEVTGNFFADLNNLKSLKGCPTKVGLDFYCNNNKLKTLKGAPSMVGGNFECENQDVVGYGFTKEDVMDVCDVKGRIRVDD